VLQLFTLAVGWLMLKSTKQGAQTTIHLAVSEDVRGISGMFVVKSNKTDFYISMYNKGVIGLQSHTSLACGMVKVEDMHLLCKGTWSCVVCHTLYDTLP